MQTLNKKVLLAGVIAAIALPALIFAQTTDPVPTVPGSNFCAKLPTYQSNYTQFVTNQTAIFNSKKQTFASQNPINRANLASQIKISRATADTNYQLAFKSLEAQATTPAETTAVKTYEDTMNAAITKVRSAIDSAISVYESGVDKILSGGNTTISSQATTFQNAVNAAFAKAQASCSSGTAGITARTTLVADLNTAKQAFIVANKTSGSISSQIRNLATTRFLAIETAQSQYNSTLANATSTLLSAFPPVYSQIQLQEAKIDKSYDDAYAQVYGTAGGQ